MEIELFTLCDFAEDMGNGKMVIVGTFNMIFVKNLPAVHPICSIAARIRVDKIDGEKHKFSISILDFHGSNIVPQLEGQFSAHFPEKTASSGVNIIINIGQLKLANEGEHSINLIIDGKLERSLPFFVRQKSFLSQ